MCASFPDPRVWYSFRLPNHRFGVKAPDGHEVLTPARKQTITTHTHTHARPSGAHTFWCDVCERSFLCCFAFLWCSADLHHMHNLHTLNAKLMALLLDGSSNRAPVMERPLCDCTTATVPRAVRHCAHVVALTCTRPAHFVSLRHANADQPHRNAKGTLTSIAGCAGNGLKQKFVTIVASRFQVLNTDPCTLMNIDPWSVYQFLATYVAMLGRTKCCDVLRGGGLSLIQNGCTWIQFT